MVGEGAVARAVPLASILLRVSWISIRLVNHVSLSSYLWLLVLVKKGLLPRRHGNGRRADSTSAVRS